MTKKLVSKTQNDIGLFQCGFIIVDDKKSGVAVPGSSAFMLEKFTQPMRAMSPPNMHCVTSVSSIKSATVGVFIPEKWAHMKNQDLLFSFLLS